MLKGRTVFYPNYLIFVLTIEGGRFLTMSEAHINRALEIPRKVQHLGVVGSCNIDLVVRCRDLPRPGETIIGEDLRRLPGGKGANQAVAASHLGADVSFIGCVGLDADGDWLIDSLRGHGVHHELMQRAHRSSGTAFIIVDDRGENEIVVAPGANEELNISDIDLLQFDVVLAQLEISGAIIEEAARRSNAFILNIAPASTVKQETLELCSVVIANELEVTSVDLNSLAHCVVTLGAKGAVHYRYGREVARAQAPIVDAVDTVGAGDVFCAAYAIEFARGSTPQDALEFSVTAGALATLANGAQGALPTEPSVHQLLVDRRLNPRTN
jgi:ribokinase